MNKTRAMRRHHFFRKKEKMLHDNYCGVNHIQDPDDKNKAASKLANNPKSCSCFLCKNPRILGYKTLAEEKSEIDFKMQMKEINS